HRLLAETRGGQVDEAKERRALRFVAVTFFVLAAYVTVEGIGDLIAGETPNTSIVGIALTGLSIIVMPWLAHAKAKAGRAMNSRLVLADGAETRLCAWLSASGDPAAGRGPRVLSGRARAVRAAAGRGAAHGRRSHGIRSLARRPADPDRGRRSVVAGWSALHRAGTGRCGGIGRGAAGGIAARFLGRVG
ncbi:MAG: hypothetical protein ACRDQB_08750, partial [Thermocrispum sp.]